MHPPGFGRGDSWAFCAVTGAGCKGWVYLLRIRALGSTVMNSAVRYLGAGDKRGSPSASRQPPVVELPAGRSRACYELGRKSHRNADSTVGLVPSPSLFPVFLSHF